VTRAALEAMYDFYSMWGKSRNTPDHKGEYYNMRIRKFVYINGGFPNQLKLAKPEVTVMDFGPERTGCQTLIRSMLEKVRQIEV
jgi:hypothetical protein